VSKAKKAGTKKVGSFAALNERTHDQRSRKQLPKVGIFFVYKDHLFIEGTSVGKAQPYGDFKGHARGHPSFWKGLQHIGAGPREVEYDEVARGRVGFAAKQGIFQVFMDKCIFENRDMVDRIKHELNLPAEETAPPQLDSHYKCPGCKSKEQSEQEEADWGL
jgi:hypothetical protein